MAKTFFATDDHSVGFLAAANLGMAGLGRIVDNIEPILHILLVSGQIVVAAFTAIYIWRKTKAIRKT